MKLFGVNEINKWDETTLINQSITGIQLMERAGKNLFEWINSNFKEELTNVLIVVGSGNNGGDGLVIARLLNLNNINVTILDLNLPKRTAENKHFYSICKRNNITFINELSSNDKYTLIIDCAFGNGLKREISGDLKTKLRIINKLKGKKIAIDLPSGLHGDDGPIGEIQFIADITLAIQQPKRSFFLPESNKFLGETKTVNIDLCSSFQTSQTTKFHLIDEEFHINPNKRKKDTHKKHYGHVVLIAGSKNMVGACLLTAKSILRSGCGLLTVLMPEGTSNRMNQHLPEAMVIERKNNSNWNELINHIKNPIIAIGPGLGTGEKTSDQLKTFINNQKKPMIIDADALNIIAQYNLLDKLPASSIITPHTGEFDRLFPNNGTFLDRQIKQINASKKHNIIIVHKFSFTFISSPFEELFINDNGNPGMATAGSGDVLTGVISALIAQKLTPIKSAISGVYHHALAGDKASQKRSQMNMIASDIIENLFIN